MTHDIIKKEQAKLIVKFIEQRQGRFHSPYTYKELKLVEQSHKNNRPKS